MIGIHFGVGICYSPPASPCLYPGERAAHRKKKKGALVRKIVKALFDPKKFLAKVDETGIRQSLNVRPACGCVLRAEPEHWDR